jgi:glycosyltransferase involved in cell wall biosynthesis
MSQKLAIGFLGTDLAPLSPDAGGLEKLVTGWALELSRRHHVSLFSYLPTRTSLPDVEIKPASALASSLKDLDIVIANNRFLPTFELEVPSIVVLHNTESAWDSLRYGPRTTVVAVSEFLANHAQKALALSYLPRVVTPFVDNVFLSKPKPVSKEIDIFFPNRLLKKKGVVETLDALSHTKRTRVTFVANFSPWTHPTEEHIELLKRIEDNQHCQLIQRISEPIRLARLMASARCVICPSIEPEGFGLVAAEALSVGTTTLVSPAGALDELAHYGAIVVDPTDPRAFAEALDAAEPHTTSGPLPFRLTSSAQLLEEAIFDCIMDQ